MPIKTLQPPVLYFKSNDFTMSLLELADLAELDRFIRIYICRTEGMAHYLIIIPYDIHDVGDEASCDPEMWKQALDTWERKVTAWFENHGRFVYGITDDEAQRIMALYDNGPARRLMVNRHKIGSKEEWERLFSGLFHQRQCAKRR